MNCKECETGLKPNTVFAERGYCKDCWEKQGSAKASKYYEYYDYPGQTADEHYKLEEMIWEFEASPEDLGVIKECLSLDDPFLNLALVMHDKAGSIVFQEILSSDAAADVKDIAERRLNGSEWTKWETGPEKEPASEELKSAYSHPESDCPAEKDAPRWLAEPPQWPCLGNTPMTFIEQFTCPEMLLHTGKLFPESTVYLFYAQKIVKGWSDYQQEHYTALEGHYGIVRYDHSSGTYTALAPLSQGGRGIAYSSVEEKKRESSPPADTEEEYKDARTFGSNLLEVCMKEYSAKYSTWLRYELFEKYKAEGSPKRMKVWIRDNVNEIFEFSSRRPRWAGGKEPDWLYLDAVPMLFLQQLYFSSDMIFLFAGYTPEGKLEFKIVNQYLTKPKKYYELKALLDAFDSAPQNMKVIKRCIAEKDKYIHRHLLDHDLPRAALDMLQTKSANSSLRKEAKDRLK